MLTLEHAVSPWEEMLAYEVLLGRPNSSIQTIVDALRAAAQLPSEFLRHEEGMIATEMREEVGRFLAKKSGFSVSIAGDFQYPRKLREAKCPVELFYYRGDLGMLESSCVSIVGARSAGEKGLSRARRLARGLVEAGFTILSGLARGIDTAAMSEAVKAGGKVVGVIGTPIDQSYPAENAIFQEKVAREHLLISQVPFFRYHNERWDHKRRYFPMRNATMSALSQATVIVEASQTSGTLIQARAALDQGRKLFILNSCFENRQISWPAYYAERGAIRVSSLDDILSHLTPPATASA